MLGTTHETLTKKGNEINEVIIFDYSLPFCCRRTYIQDDLNEEGGFTDKQRHLHIILLKQINVFSYFIKNVLK